MRKIKLSLNRVDYNSLSLIAGNVASLYKEGIPVLTMIDLLVELPVNKSYKESLMGIKKSIIDGKALSDSFNEFDFLYPEFFIGMVSMGENSGSLQEVMEGLEHYYGKMRFLKSTIKNALSYPSLVFLSVITLFVFIVFVTVPNLYEFYINLNIPIPFLCRFVYELVNYIEDNKVLSLIYFISWGIGVPFILFKFYLRNLIKLLFSKITIIKEFNEFVFISLLSLIVKSGVNLSNGLIYSSTSFKSSNLKERFLILNSSILKGESISESLRNQGDYSNYTRAIIRLGEESGSMDERLKELSSYLERKLLSNIDKHIAILQPASILIMGGFVIIFLMIFIVPLFGSLLDGGI